MGGSPHSSDWEWSLTVIANRNGVLGYRLRLRNGLGQEQVVDIAPGDLLPHYLKLGQRLGLDVLVPLQPAGSG